MADSFESLFENENSVEDLEKTLDKLNEKKTYEDPTESDPRFWTMKHLRGEDGTGNATIRFLPSPKGAVSPFVRYFSHFYQGPHGVYAEKSRKSLGNSEDDPVYEYNGTFFQDKSLSEEDRKKKIIKRKPNYIGNILVINDPVEPENNGKVFLYEYGQQIFNKITEKAKPEFADQEKIDVFNILNGANFKLRITNKNIGKKVVPSYEKSEFESPSQLAKTKEKMKKIWESEYQLDEFVAEDKFKSYEELKAKFDKVLGLNQVSEKSTGRSENSNMKSTKENSYAEDNEDTGSIEEEESPPFDVDDDDDDFIARLNK